jgi:hypothetical protein
MSAEQNSGIRRAVRQLALALVACLAVAGGAAVAAAPDKEPAKLEQHAGTAVDWPGPAPTASPTTN